MIAPALSFEYGRLFASSNVDASWLQTTCESQALGHRSLFCENFGTRFTGQDPLDNTPHVILSRGQSGTTRQYSLCTSCANAYSRCQACSRSLPKAPTGPIGVRSDASGEGSAEIIRDVDQVFEAAPVTENEIEWVMTPHVSGPCDRNVCLMINSWHRCVDSLLPETSSLSLSP